MKKTLRKNKIQPRKFKTPSIHRNVNKKTAVFEAKKPFLIAVISIVAVAIMASLIFLAPQFVGKAYFYVGGIDTAGISGPEIITVGEWAEYELKANISECNTVAFEVKLTFPTEYLECNIDPMAIPVSEWHPNLDVINEFTCNNLLGVVNFTRAALYHEDYPHTGELTLAKVRFRALALPPDGKIDVNVNKFKVYDLETSQPIGLSSSPNVVINITEEAAVDLCAGITCTPISTTCPDNEVISCTPTCDPVTGVCGTCTPDCTGHELMPTTLSSVDGTKIILEELPMTQDGNLITFNTKITAKVDLPDPGFKIITQVEDVVVLGKVLLYKRENIAAMNAGDIKTIQTIYRLKTGTTQVKKKIITYDKWPGDTLGCNQLQHTHQTS